MPSVLNALKKFVYSNLIGLSVAHILYGGLITLTGILYHVNPQYITLSALASGIAREHADYTKSAESLKSIILDILAFLLIPLIYLTLSEIFT